MTSASDQLSLSWGAVALGSMAGLGLALVAYLILGTTGLTDATPGAAALIFLQYAAQFAAGFLAGRLTTHSRVLHGGLAAMIMAAVGIAIGLGFSGRESSFGLIVLALAIAATTGSAGGAIAEFSLRT